MSQRLGGEVDVCCRDPNYKSVDFFALHILMMTFPCPCHAVRTLLMNGTRDPWPEQEQAREESRALGGDEWRYPPVQQSYNFRTS